MTSNSLAQTNPVLVAIDISKARHEVLSAVPGKKRRRRITILNQLDGFNRLITTLSDYCRTVRVAFEATRKAIAPSYTHQRKLVAATIFFRLHFNRSFYDRAAQINPRRMISVTCGTLRSSSVCPMEQ